MYVSLWKWQGKLVHYVLSILYLYFIPFFFFINDSTEKNIFLKIYMTVKIDNSRQGLGEDVALGCNSYARFLWFILEEKCIIWCFIRKTNWICWTKTCILMTKTTKSTHPGFLALPNDFVASLQLLLQLSTFLFHTNNFCKKMRWLILKHKQY